MLKLTRWTPLLMAPLLLACSSDEQSPEPEPNEQEKTKPTKAMATLGEEGGTLETEVATLDFPEGAVPKGTDVVVEPLSSNDVKDLPSTGDKVSLASTPMRFEPHGLKFAKPVQVEMAFDPSKFDSDNLVVLRLEDEEDTTWEVVPGATFENGKALFQISSFSIYAIGSDPDGVAMKEFGAGGASGTGGAPSTGGMKSDGGSTSSGGASMGEGGSTSGGASMGEGGSMGGGATGEGGKGGEGGSMGGSTSEGGTTSAGGETGEGGIGGGATGEGGKGGEGGSMGGSTSEGGTTSAGGEAGEGGSMGGGATGEGGIGGGATGEGGKGGEGGSMGGSTSEGGTTSAGGETGEGGSMGGGATGEGGIGGGATGEGGKGGEGGSMGGSTSEGGTTSAGGETGEGGSMGGGSTGEGGSMGGSTSEGGTTGAGGETGEGGSMGGGSTGEGGSMGGGSTGEGGSMGGGSTGEGGSMGGGSTGEGGFGGSSGQTPVGFYSARNWSGFGFTYVGGTSTIDSDLAERPGPNCAWGTTDADYENDFAILGYNVAQSEEGEEPGAVLPIDSGDGVRVFVEDYWGSDLRVSLSDGVRSWCAPLRRGEEFISWSEFNTACWDGSGEPLDPEMDAIVTAQILVPSMGQEDVPFDFCLVEMFPDVAGQTGGGGSDAAGFYYMGSWSGYGWTDVGGTSMIESDLEGRSGPNCAWGTTGADYEADFAILGYNVAQGEEGGEPLLVYPADHGDGMWVMVDDFMGSELRINLSNGVTSWCAPISSSGPQFIPWSEFNTSCWDGSGAMLDPYMDEIGTAQIIVPSNGQEDAPFDFCLAELYPDFGGAHQGHDFPGFYKSAGWSGYGWTLVGGVSTIDSDLSDRSGPNCAWGTTGSDYENDFAILGYNVSQTEQGEEPQFVYPIDNGEGVWVTVEDYMGSELRVNLSNGTTSWCAPIVSNGEQFISWSEFNTACWDGSGSSLDPGMDQIDSAHIVVPSNGQEETPFEFCLVQLSPGSGDGGSGSMGGGGAGEGGSMGGEETGAGGGGAGGSGSIVIGGTSSGDTGEGGAPPTPPTAP